VPYLIDTLRRWLGGPKPYGVRHFRRRRELRDDYALLAEALLEQLDFDSVLDVGCANGFLLERFAAAGREIAGIELSPEVAEVLPPEVAPAVVVGDFGEVPWRFPRPFDLVCCVEVAEHIDPARSRELVTVVTGAARRWIYFTAAAPGQSGRGHINCRPHEEWLDWFAGEGWRVAEPETGALRSDLERLTRAHWLRDNSFVLDPTTVR
jgi:SAM-dependent methyltransferase